MAGIGRSLGEPVTQFTGNLLADVWRYFEAQNRPKPPNYAGEANRNSSSPVGLGSALASRVGNTPGISNGQMGGSGQQTPNSIMSLYLGDQERLAESQDAYNDQARIAAGLMRTGRESAVNTLEGSKGFLQKMLDRGEKAVQFGRDAIGQGRQDARDSAFAGVRAAATLFKDWKASAESMYQDVVTTSNEAFNNAKDRSAALLVQMNDANVRGTGQAVADAKAEMMAMGVPEAQMNGNLAQIAADGARRGVDALYSAGAQEGARLDQLKFESAKEKNAFRSLQTHTQATLGAATSKDITANMTGLANNQAYLANAAAALESNANTWRSSMSQQHAYIDNMIADATMKGFAGEAGYLASIQKYAVSLGPIAEGGFSMFTGLEDAQYAYDLGFFNSGLMDFDQFINNTKEGWNRFGEINEQRHQEGVMQNIASQNRTAGLASAAITAGGSVMSAGIGRGSPISNYNPGG